jgi:hypothetical protein
METVVNRYLAVGLGLALPKRLYEPFLRLRLDEIDDGCRAAEGRRDGAGGEVVAADVVASGHLEVDVRVDAAREHIAPGGVDLLGACQAFRDGGNARSTDADIGLQTTVRGEDDTVLYDQIHS